MDSDRLYAVAHRLGDYVKSPPLRAFGPLGKRGHLDQGSD
jgi:hypothetical protein